MKERANPKFGRWRNLLWPIHRHELIKIVPMLVIFFLLSFCYNTLRILKDSLVVPQAGAGAKVIPFIKMWVMFPGSILMTYIFTRLSNRLNRETVFYCMLSIFLIFFAVFTFVLYPIHESIHLHSTADWLAERLPVGFGGMIAMVRYWIFSIFYAMSELWSNIVLFLLFWAFANEITKLEEAKRFYGILGIGTNFSGIIAGFISVQVMSLNFNPAIPYGNSAWEQQLAILIVLTLIFGVLSMLVYRWMNVKVLSNSRYYTPDASARDRGVKGRMSMRQNFSYLFKSPYLLKLAFIVIAYNVIIQLVEVLWKDQVQELYPDKSDYGRYMNYVMIVIGFLATFTSIFLSTNLVRKFGWTFTALITPLMLLFTSIGFFFFYFAKDASHIFPLLGGFSPLTMVVFFGTVQNCLSRASKYTVYDTTKEMAFVPLTTECKLKGKAAIDGVCNRLGKSGGAVIHQSLLFIFVELSATFPYVACFLFTFLALWTKSVLSLGKQFNQLSQQQTEEEPQKGGEEEEQEEFAPVIAT